MTAEEIVTALRSRAITELRARKLKALCQRMKVDEADVLKLLTKKERAKLLA